MIAAVIAVALLAPTPARVPILVRLEIGNSAFRDRLYDDLGGQDPVPLLQSEAAAQLAESLPLFEFSEDPTGPCEYRIDIELVDVDEEAPWPPGEIGMRLKLFWNAAPVSAFRSVVPVWSRDDENTLEYVTDGRAPKLQRVLRETIAAWGVDDAQRIFTFPRIPVAARLTRGTVTTDLPYGVETGVLDPAIAGIQVAFELRSGSGAAYRRDVFVVCEPGAHAAGPLVVPQALAPGPDACAGALPRRQWPRGTSSWPGLYLWQLFR